QITDAGFFSSLPDEPFAMAFGTEWYIRVGANHPLREGWLFE
ncbi:MAG: GlcNAc-PI de-N-acetylase, partial [Actinobacteria bacterium]|nr:GlcNAc-PI de-N-acetylase [Actinomycetota bacterium]